MDWKLFVSTFTLISLAELPDKTVFAVLLMATKRDPRSTFVGVCMAFFVQSLIAVSLGRAISFFPEKWVHLATGFCFIAFAIALLRKGHEETELENEKIVKSDRRTFWRAVSSSFMVIFVAEWGDLTQLATASLEARFRSPVTIFTAATLALCTVAALAIVVGTQAKKFLHARLLNRLAAAAFAVVGLYFILSWIRQ